MHPTPLLVAALVALPLTAVAQDANPLPAPTTPREFHRLRENRMGQGGRALAALKQVADSHGDLAAEAPRVQLLVQLAADLPSLFPAGSGGERTEATPQIWSDTAGFQRALDRFKTATDALAATASAGDHAAFLTAWTEARASCNGCHMAYRQ